MLAVSGRRVSGETRTLPDAAGKGSWVCSVHCDSTPGSSYAPQHAVSLSSSFFHPRTTSFSLNFHM